MCAVACYIFKFDYPSCACAAVRAALKVHQGHEVQRAVVAIEAEILDDVEERLVGKKVGRGRAAV